MKAHFPPLSNGRFVTRFPLGHLSITALVAAVLVAVPETARAEDEQGPIVLLLVLPRTTGGEIEEAVALRLEDAGVRVRHLSSLSPCPIERDSDWEALEEHARGLELDMRFREAAEAWRAYRDRLLREPGAVLEPARLAEAQLSLAASWVESGEIELARLEFRRALGIDLRFSPGPAYSPRVREFFDEAGLQGPSLPPVPSDVAVDLLIEEAGAGAFLWIASARDEAGWVLARRLRLAGATGPSSEVRRLLAGEPRADSVDILAEADRVALELQSLPSPGGRWRRWWPVAAGAVAVAAVGLGTAHVLSPPLVEVVVRH